jgi:Cu2+-exporting ATPase
VTTIETDHQHGHGAHGDHGDRRGHGVHDGHAGHDPDLFRRRFWLSLALTIPLVVTSEMVQDWFGYSLDVPASRSSPRCSGRSCSGGAAGRS